MMHTREDAIRSGKCSDLGRETVGIQDPVGNMGKVVDERLQHAFTEAVLDQLAANGADVKGIAGSLGNSKMLHCLPLNIKFHNNSKPITFRPFSTKRDSYNFNSLNLKKN